MTRTLSTSETCPVQRSILRSLLYFEAFGHPMTLAELYQHAMPDADAPAVQPEVFAEKVRELLQLGLIWQHGAFLMAQDRPDWVEKRAEQNQRADAFLPIAQRMARFIGAFPYVRAVCVSGSLSKHCMRADSDIDFFLVTAPGRLWLARTLLVLFKKLFLFNSHKYFCVNYFVDTEHLEIEEKNLFTALETVTLLPMTGAAQFEAFQRANAWAWGYFPHFPPRSAAALPPLPKPWAKRAAEWLLAGRLGNWLDARCMGLTVGFWQRKFRHLNHDTFQVALKSRRYVSKHHPLHFQEKLLQRLAQRMAELEGRSPVL
jgi:hypothetical protein